MWGKMKPSALNNYWLKRCLKIFVRMATALILVVFVLICFVSPSSATYRISSAHTPSSSLEGFGSVSLGSFEYAPVGLVFNNIKNSYCGSYKYEAASSMTTKKICIVGNHEIIKYGHSKKREFQGDVYEGSRYVFDNSIPEYLKKAVHNELKFIGYKVNNSSNIIIDCKIEKFLFDRSNRNTFRFLVELVITVKEKTENKILIEEKSTGEFLYADFEHIDVTSAIYTATSRAIENFVLSAQSSGVLRSVK